MKLRFIVLTLLLSNSVTIHSAEICDYVYFGARLAQIHYTNIKSGIPSEAQLNITASKLDAYLPSKLIGFRNSDPDPQVPVRDPRNLRGNPEGLFTEYIKASNIQRLRDVSLSSFKKASEHPDLLTKDIPEQIWLNCVNNRNLYE